MFTPEQLAALAAHLDSSMIRERSQSGTKLSYIEGHAVMRAANRIFGFGNWQRNQPDYTCVMTDTYDQQGKTMHRVGYVCQLSITTWGTGYGDQVTSESIGKAHEGAVKEAETDAMKRALIALGDQFGLALYEKDGAHIDRGGQAQRQVQHHQQTDRGGSPATDKQRWLIDQRIKVLGWQDAEIDAFAAQHRIDWDRLTKQRASEVIELLTDIQRGGKIEVPA